jgi:hypothetical protein
MKNFFDNLMIWIKANVLIFVIILVVGLFLLFPRQLKKLFRGAPRRRRHTVALAAPRRKLPRSVGAPKQYSKSGKVKKPWQIKGSEAARRHMAKIRRMK